MLKSKMKVGFIYLFIFCLLYHCLSITIQRHEWQKYVRQVRHGEYLVRRANINLQWELFQVQDIRPELDELRWMRHATELRHADWALIIRTIYRKAKEYGLRPDLMLAVGHRESDFDPFAKSFKLKRDDFGNIINDKNGNPIRMPIAWGLMQVNYDVWAKPMSLDKQNVLDIEINVDTACQIMRLYLTETDGDEIRALELYNAGYKFSNPRYVPRIKSSMFYRGTP